ncbi:MATE family efflux transporter [Bacillus fonticola]|uniref:MATE family efflux transporter n=1 Tax=Bacillus fonticola TaxID=2728853 RepID=UPI0014747CB3|nr:MATE family efflux transporter [Bacillus fonticola]
MKRTLTKKDKMKQFLIIFLPILFTQVGLFSMSFFDTFMSGQASPADLAGVAVGSSLWMPVFTGFTGILLATTPIVAQQIGGERYEKVAPSVMQAIYVSIAMAILVLTAGAFLLDPVLNLMSLEQEVRDVARGYLIALSFGIFPLFIYNVLRCFIDALGMTRVTMWITLTTVPLNVTTNYIFIYGKFGAPQLGGIGAGVASSVTYWSIFFIALWIVRKKIPFVKYGLFSSWVHIDWKEWRALLTIGIPIGSSIFFETSIFAAVTLFMSVYDTVTIASHQAAINFASFMYMVPLSISMALTIVVSYEVGAKRAADARQYSMIGIAFAVLISLFSAMILIVFREPIALIYTNDKEVFTLTSTFLIFAAFFQVSDALQAPIQGALRAYKDVNTTFFVTLVSYWVLGLPTGYMLANMTELGPFGYWIGLTTGLTLGAIGLGARLWHVQNKFRKTKQIAT